MSRTLIELEAQIKEDHNAHQELTEWEAVTEVPHVGIEDPSAEEFLSRRRQAHANGKPFKFSKTDGKTYFSAFPSFEEAVKVTTDDWNEDEAPEPESKSDATDEEKIAAFVKEEVKKYKEREEKLLQKVSQLETQVHKYGEYTPEEVARNYTNTARTMAQEVYDVVRQVEENKPDGFDELTLKRVKQLIIEEEAKKIHEMSKLDVDFDQLETPKNLAQWLEEPDKGSEWRVQNMFMQGHITTIAAPAKAGKSTFAINRLKSFADGTPLFDYFKVKPVEGNICYINYELDENQFKVWLRSLDIKNTHKIFPINARGKEYYIQHRPVADKLIEFLNDNDIEILEIDPLQAGFLGTVSSDQDAGDWISALQRIVARTSVKDVIITTHTGNNEDVKRSIGSARWQGFPDNMIHFSRVKSEKHTTSIEIPQGRDIQLDPIQLKFNPDTRIMTYAGQAKDKAANDREKFIFKYAQAVLEADDNYCVEGDWIKAVQVANDVIQSETGSDKKNSSKEKMLKDARDVWVGLGLMETKKIGTTNVYRFTTRGMDTFENWKQPADYVEGIESLLAAMKTF